MNCKYYCKDYQLEGMCKLHSDWSDPMPIIKYCPKSPCTDYQPKNKRNIEQLPGQLDMFDIIDKKENLND